MKESFVSLKVGGTGKACSANYHNYGGANNGSFTFVTKTPPAAVLIKKACGIESGSGVPNKTKVAKITREQVQKIAEQKMPDLNAANIESAMSMIAGTARSMGIEVVD